MVKTIVSAVSSEREVERMVKESAMSEGEPVRMRWGGRVCTATTSGRFSWEEDRVASSQVVIGDDACRGLVNVLTSGAFHYQRTVGFAMGEDVVQTLHNASDESVGGFDLKRCQMGTVSVQHPSFFDFGGRVVYVNASPTVAGQDAYVHFHHKSNGVLTHSGDQSSGTGRERRLGHFITTTGTVTEPVALVFTSYAESTLSQFGVAIFFVYDTHDYSLHTNVGILHFKATHIHCGDALRERRLTLSREDPSGTLIPIVDEHDVATLLANKMLDDLHLDRCQNNPPLQHYTIQFSNERETHRIHITVCPYPECILQTPSKSSVCISFKEPVVVTDAESGTCHTLVHTVSPSQLRAIKNHFKTNVDTDEMNTVFREIESTEAALHGARPDVTGISDEMLCKQFGEQCALRAKQLRDKEELDAQHAVDDVYR